ncbi:MAG: hypothetical protein EU539_00535 [Promethearchaeota archaeon]|nr:MAG: hypothetical protein EU539_00535 [Candidatus Lokiarchaeota archaeon]
MISPLGLLDGLTASGIILSSTIFGLLSFYNAKKLEAKLLAVAGVLMIFIGLFWLGPFSDFLSVLIFGKNIQPIYIYGWLSYIWVAPAIILAMYLGSELMVPEKKKIIMVFYGIIGIIFELFLFLDVSGTFIFSLTRPGQDTIDASFNRTSITFFIIAFFLISVLIFEGIGFAIKARQATGDIRRKFTYLSLAFIIFVVCGALDSIISLGVAIGIIRIVMMSFALFMYLGLKT